MAKLVIVFACVALLQTAIALECYSCNADQCKDPQEKWQKETCGRSALVDQEAACQKITYKDASGNKIVKRNCGQAPKSGAEVACPVMPGVTDMKCPVCKTDLCNSASSINLSFTAVAGIVLALLSHKYLL